MFQFNRQLVCALAFLQLSVVSRSSAADGQKYFPEATQVVVTVNVQQILHSALLAGELGRIRRELERNDQVKQTLESIGFDPLKDLNSVTLASAGPSDSEKTVLVLVGSFDAKRIHAKAEDVARAKGELLKIHQDKGHAVYETNLPAQSKTLFVAVLDPTTLIASFKRAYVVDALDIRAGTKMNALQNQVRDLLEKSDPKQSITLVSMGSALAKDLPQAEKIRHLAGGITIGDNITTDFTIAATDRAAATDLARQLKEGLDQGKNFLTLIAMNQKELSPLVEVLGSLRVTEQGSDVKITGEVTKEFLDRLKNKQ